MNKVDEYNKRVLEAEVEEYKKKRFVTRKMNSIFGNHHVILILGEDYKLLLQDLVRFTMGEIRIAKSETELKYRKR